MGTQIYAIDDGRGVTGRYRAGDVHGTSLWGLVEFARIDERQLSAIVASRDSGILRRFEEIKPSIHAV